MMNRCRFFPRIFRARWTGLLLILWCLLTLAALWSAGWASAGETPKPSPAKLKKILADFAKYAEAARQDWEVPGMAIAIVQDDKVIFAKGFGVKKVDDDEAVDEQTIFQIGSTTKAFAAAQVAMLVDEKKVAWQDRLMDHLPDFRMYDPWVTREFMVEDVLAARSGLFPYGGDRLALLGFDRAYLMQALRRQKPIYSFRSRYTYHNGILLLAGALVEKHTGQSWEDNLRERIFKPLGMSATSADLKGFQEAKNVSAVHVQRDGKVTALPADWPYHLWVYTYGPAGSINSNVVDMCNWLRLHLGRGKFNDQQLISRENLEFLFTPKTVMGFLPIGMTCYCEAWVYTVKCPFPMIWHTGGTSGHKTMVALMPEAGIGIVILSNLITDLPEALTFQFYDLYFQKPPRDMSKAIREAAKQAEAAKKAPQAPATPAPALPLERYGGVYENPIYGKITVTAGQDSLEAVLGPRQTKMLLRPWNRDLFRVDWPGMSDSAPTDMGLFLIGLQGRAESLFFQWDGQTEFKRVEEKAAP